MLPCIRCRRDALSPVFGNSGILQLGRFAATELLPGTVRVLLPPVRRLEVVCESYNYSAHCYGEARLELAWISEWSLCEKRIFCPLDTLDQDTDIEEDRDFSVTN